MPEPRQNLPFSLMRIARRMGVSDQEIAKCTGMSRSGVQAVCSGVYSEHLTAEGKRNLLMYVRMIRDQAIDAVLEMEMMA